MTGAEAERGGEPERRALSRAVRNELLVLAAVLAACLLHAALASKLARVELLAGVLSGRYELVLAAVGLLAIRFALTFVAPAVVSYASVRLGLEVWRAGALRRRE